MQSLSWVVTNIQTGEDFPFHGPSGELKADQKASELKERGISSTITCYKKIKEKLVCANLSNSSPVPSSN